MKPIYKKGARKEYAICEKLKKEGWDIVQRTAGSHSPIDVIAINRLFRKILFVQSKRKLNEKMSYVDKVLKRKIENENFDLNGMFDCAFEAR